MNTTDYSPTVRAMLADRDLNALVAVLRSPADAGLRAQAARALGELGDVDATESLIRALSEDPDPAIQAAARLALTEMHGGNSELVIDSYRGGPPEMDEWLVEPEEEDIDVPSRGSGPVTEADIDGLLMIVSQESNPVIREKAIRALAHIQDTRSTDMLAFLALHGDEDSVRSAAREVLEAHFGEQAEEIIQAANTDEEDEWADEEEGDLPDEDENESSEDEVDDEHDEELDEELEEDESESTGAWGLASPTSRPSDFPQGPSMASQDRGSPVVQEVGVPWRILIIVGLAILILAAVLLLRP